MWTSAERNCGGCRILKTFVSYENCTFMLRVCKYCRYSDW